MKYGLLYWKETNNIGDDIQSYAGLQFLPQVDYLVDREYMNAFESDGHEPVTVIMNAWFLYNKFNWPPANEIVPLCIAMHFTGGKDYRNGLAFLDGLGGDYLRYFGPVGCRDEESCNLLNNKGIEAYFSGCLTLTIPKQNISHSDKQYVCVADVEPKVKHYIDKQLAGTGVEVEKVTHLVDAKEYSRLSFEARMQAVRDLLAKYQNARCVVTSRLHCALPCLAMGAPVLFICDHQSDYRLKSFLKLLHVTTTDELCGDKCSYSLINPPSNGDEYLSMRHQIEATVKDFINRVNERRISTFEMSPMQRAAFQTEYIKGCFDMIDSMNGDELKRYLSNCGLKKLLHVLKTGFGCIPTTVKRAIKNRW